MNSPAFYPTSGKVSQCLDHVSHIYLCETEQRQVFVLPAWKIYSSIFFFTSSEVDWKVDSDTDVLPFVTLIQGQTAIVDDSGL